MAEVNFELYNNQLVQQLVGVSDANLRLIEQLLNVEISSFGNQINIKGDDDAGAAAHDAAQADDDGGKQGEKQHGLDLAGHGISLMCEVGIRSL